MSRSQRKSFTVQRRSAFSEAALVGASRRDGGLGFITLGYYKRSRAPGAE